LDDCRFAVDPVGFGNGQLVHAGWIHTHPAGAGDRGGPDSCDPGPQPSCIAVLARVEQEGVTSVTPFSILQLAEGALQIVGLKSKRTGAALINHLPRSIDQIKTIGPSGIRLLRRVIKAVEQGRELDAEIADTTSGYC